MKPSHIALTLASAVAQGTAFAVVGHLLSARGERRPRVDHECDRLEAVERRLAAIEQRLPPQPAAGVGTGPVSALAMFEQDDLIDRFRIEPIQRHTAFDSAPPAGEFPRVRPAASYLEEGAVYFEVGNYERAIDRFGRAIDVQPDLCPAYFNRALALARLGKIEEALNDYDRAATLDPDDADIFNNRGLLRFAREEAVAAAADFERALELRPDDADARANLALVRRQLMTG